MQARIIYCNGKVELARGDLESLNPKVREYVERLMKYHKKNMGALSREESVKSAYGSLELDILPDTKL
jgi:hypothetical protein